MVFIGDIQIDPVPKLPSNFNLRSGKKNDMASCRIDDFNLVRLGTNRGGTIQDNRIAVLFP